MNIKLIEEEREFEYETIEVQYLNVGCAYLSEVTGSIYIPTGNLDSSGRLIFVHIVPRCFQISTNSFMPSSELCVKRINIKDVIIHYANIK